MRLSPKIGPFVLVILFAGLGGFVAENLRLPMPWLLGALLASAVLATSLPRAISPLSGRLPDIVIMPLVALVGVEIGSTFTPEIARSALKWWPSLLAVAGFVITAQIAGYFTLRGLNRATDRPSAWFAAAPGGLLENVLLGKDAGGSERFITTIQFLRLIAIICILPLGFSVWAGRQVGSAAGLSQIGGESLSLMSGSILLGCAIVGRWVGKLIHVPAYNLVGPLLLSALAHVLLDISGSVPWEILVAAQVVIGAGLGLAFAGFPLTMLMRALVGVLILVGVMLLLTFGFAFGTSALTGQSAELLILGFAPAGVIEMSLIALTLGIDPVFVTTHHILRILVTVLVTPFLFRALIARGTS